MAADNEREAMVFEGYGIPLYGPPEQAEAMNVRARYLADNLPDSFFLDGSALYVTDYEPPQREFDDLYEWVRRDEE